MTNQVVPFIYNPLHSTSAKEVRTFRKEDGSAWFIAKDVCDVLGLGNPSMACEKLDDDEKLVSKLLIAGQNRDALCVSESRLYSLVFRSNKPEAKRFRKWVTSEVLPKIRETVMPGTSATEFVDSVVSGHFSKTSEDKKPEDENPLYAMMNLDRCPLGMSKQQKMYFVKTAIATIAAPATSTGRKFILDMLDELNIR